MRTALDNYFIELELAKLVDTDPAHRLRRTVQAINDNPEVCGVEILTADGTWQDALSKEQFSKLKKLPIPRCQTASERGMEMEAAASKIVKELGKLQYEII